MTQKRCKGIGKAKGYGCGDLSLYRKYGLCQNGNKCYQKWLINTEAGQELIHKFTLKAKRESEKDRRAKTKQERINLMSVDLYRSKILQPKINEIIRLIDFGNGCIATGATTGKMNAGHFTSVGANRGIALNLHNIFLQSEHSNSFKGGDEIRYLEGLRKTFSYDYAEFVISLRGASKKGFKKFELKEAYEIAKAVAIRLKKDNKKRTSIERITLRNKIQKELGLYNSFFDLDSYVDLSP